MSNYFQKIASRSGRFQQDENSPAQNILPDKPVFFNEKQNDVIEEGDQQSNFIVETPIIIAHSPANLNYKSGEANANNNLIQPQRKVKKIPAPGDEQKKSNLQPVTEIFSGYKKIQTPHSGATEYSNPVDNILQPPLTVIEKITQRNFQNTVIEKKSTEIRLPIESSDDKRVSNLIVPGKENIQGVKEGSKKLNSLQPSIADTYNKLKPEKPLQKFKERLIPVQKDNIPLAPMKKANQENKLVIGRITVEVINQVQPSTKTKEQPMRQSNANKIADTEFTGINKLSFGLGQL